MCRWTLLSIKLQHTDVLLLECKRGRKEFGFIKEIFMMNRKEMNYVQTIDGMRITGLMKTGYRIARNLKSDCML